MKYNTVSIIVPVYNVEEHICECVDSLIAQTYKDIEIILVNDGSTDKSGDICDYYASKDCRIKVIHKLNGGLSDARNAGIDIAKSSFITFCDSDDLLDSQAIETAIRLAITNNADLVCYESVVFSDDCSQYLPIYHNDDECKILSAEQFTEKLLYKKIDCSVCNKLFNTKVLNNLRFIKGRYNEDVIFLMQLLGRCMKIVLTNYPFYKYRSNPNSITHTFSLRTLDPLKNTKEIEEAVLLAFPNLTKPLFFYTTNAIKTVATSIVRNKATHLPIYKEAYNESKSRLKRRYLDIILSSSFNIRFKIAVSILIIL